MALPLLALNWIPSSAFDTEDATTPFSTIVLLGIPPTENEPNAVPILFVELCSDANKSQKAPVMFGPKHAWRIEVS